MGLTYFKRYRMEIDVSRPLFPLPDMPGGYELVAWSESLLEEHAWTKFRCFRHEIDAHVFPCLSNYEGCCRLMRDITQREGFLGPATWLVRWDASASGTEYCGTIQGITNRQGIGALQNIGIVPEHRGRGLGTHMLHRALLGFRQCGLTRASLEVTAKNTDAIRLYRRLGFRTLRTVYKTAEVAYA
jgi:ribosomal protein S18 acetylase RimI-like enzyme